MKNLPTYVLIVLPILPKVNHPPELFRCECQAPKTRNQTHAEMNVTQRKIEEYRFDENLKNTDPVGN